jgi:hypothetical protein
MSEYDGPSSSIGAIALTALSLGPAYTRLSISCGYIVRSVRKSSCV